MGNGKAFLEKIQIIETSIEEIEGLVVEHIATLTYPMDSWLEDRLFESVLYKILYEDDCIGYAGQVGELLSYFYVRREYFRHAQDILEKVITQKAIKRVFVITQDSLLCALMAEWDYGKEKQACWFTDGGKVESPARSMGEVTFRVADRGDLGRIRETSGDFFAEEGKVFHGLEDRVAAGVIFVLEDRENLFGCGIIEKSKFCSDIVSIGMFVGEKHRRKGAARTILLQLKKWAYENNMQPVAGCWYYNTLSRRSLESAGMIASSIGYEAILEGRERLPKRTGNPPGELVEDGE